MNIIMVETFSKQFKKHYDYIIKEEEEMWDNIYPMSDWTLEDHNLLWKYVDRKILVFDISIGGFVLTERYIEQEKEEFNKKVVKNKYTGEITKLTLPYTMGDYYRSLGIVIK